MKKTVYEQIAEAMRTAFNNAKKHIEAENKQIPFSYIELSIGRIKIPNN